GKTSFRSLKAEEHFLAPPAIRLCELVDRSAAVVGASSTATNVGCAVEISCWVKDQTIRADSIRTTLEAVQHLVLNGCPRVRHQSYHDDSEKSCPQSPQTHITIHKFLPWESLRGIGRATNALSGSQHSTTVRLFLGQFPAGRTTLLLLSGDSASLRRLFALPRGGF